MYQRFVVVMTGRQALPWFRRSVADHWSRRSGSSCRSPVSLRGGRIRFQDSPCGKSGGKWGTGI